MRKENKPRWGLDDINNMIYMYRHGTSIEEIAAELGRTKCAVKMRLSKLRDAVISSRPKSKAIILKQCPFRGRRGLEKAFEEPIICILKSFLSHEGFNAMNTQ